MLGIVLERATKKTLAEFAAENVFRPLDMTHTLFYDDASVVVPGRAPAYYPGKNGNFQVGWSTTYRLVAAAAAAAAAGRRRSVLPLLLPQPTFDEIDAGKGRTNDNDEKNTTDFEKFHCCAPVYACFGAHYIRRFANVSNVVRSC